MPYQPSNLSVQPFISRVNSEPACFGRARSVAQSRKTTVKIRGPYKQQYADQIYTSKRWPKPRNKNKKHAHNTKEQVHTCTHTTHGLDLAIYN